MGTMFDFLSPEFIESELSTRLALANEPYKRLTRAQLKSLFSNQKYFSWDNPHTPPQFEYSSHTEWLMDLAMFEQARGASPAEIRKIYHAAVSDWVNIIPAMDFKRRSYNLEIGDAPALAKQFQKAYGAKVTKDGRELSVRFQAIPQPLCFEVLEKVLLCAAIGGDQKMARQLAAGYKVQSGPLSVSSRFIVLRHLMAGEDQLAKEEAKLLKPGYPADWPPELIEFPLGVVRGDSKLLVKGLKTLNTRFKSRWDEKIWRNRCKKLMAKEKWRSNNTWDAMIAYARRYLVGMKCCSSPYALAYLNVANWRGMAKLFDDPSLFSEWIPLELCKMAQISIGETPMLQKTPASP